MIKKRVAIADMPNASEVKSYLGLLDQKLNDPNIFYVNPLCNKTIHAYFRDIPNSYTLLARVFPHLKNRSVYYYYDQDRYNPVYIKGSCPLCEKENFINGPFWCTAGKGKIPVYFCLNCNKDGFVVDILMKKLECNDRQLHHWIKYGILVDKWYLSMDDILSIPIEYVCSRAHAVAALKKAGVKKVEDFLQRTQEKLLKIKNFSIFRYREMVNDINEIIAKNVIPGKELYE